MKRGKEDRISVEELFLIKVSRKLQNLNIIMYMVQSMLK
jgi:hypothetical protein